MNQLDQDLEQLTEAEVQELLNDKARDYWEKRAEENKLNFDAECLLKEITAIAEKLPNQWKGKTFSFGENNKLRDNSKKQVVYPDEFDKTTFFQKKPKVYETSPT